MNDESMQRFPYAYCLETLAEGEALGMASPYRDLMHLIGRKCRKGGEREWTTIASAVQRSFEPLRAESDGESLMSAQRVRSTNIAIPNGGSTANGSGANDLFKYSIALKEHCDQQGELVRYNEERLRAYPPYFKATVHMQGLSFDGTGSSKKMARHHACREPCIALRINP